jgi:MFS family permease
MPSITSQEKKERTANIAVRYFRWNFTSLILEAVIFLFGMAFFDPNTILPVLLKRLGANDIEIGIPRLMQTLGYALPSLISAHYIYGRPYHKRLMTGACGIGRLFLLAIPFALIFLGIKHPHITAVICIVSLSLFWLLDGVSAISWMDILGKTIPERVRGRFFGLMQTFGGMGAVIAGFFAAAILGRGFLSFPYNFALLAGIWCALAAISQVTLCIIREPEGISDGAGSKPGILTYLKQAIPVMKANPKLPRLIIARLMMDGAGLAAPFYVLFARDRFHVSLLMVGIYITVQSTGRLLTGPLWGWLSDRFGASMGMRGVAATIFLTPLCALLSFRLGPWMIPPIFFLLGAVQDGGWMTATNALIGSTSEKDRPLAIGVASLMQTPGAIYGPLGGWLVQSFSYVAVFSVALTLGTLGLVQTGFLVREIRNVSA